MDKKRKAITLLLQIKDLKNKLSEKYKYNTSLSRENNLILQEKFNESKKQDRKEIKAQIDEKTKIVQELTNQIKAEEKNEPIKPTGNVYEQMKEMKKAQSLYIR